MKGAGKRSSEFNYIAAVNAALESSYIPYNTCEFFIENNPHNIILSSNFLNPEQCLIAKDYFRSLSPDAQTVVKIILEDPYNDFDEFTKNSKVVKKMLKKYLASKFGWKRSTIKLVLQEIKENIS